MSNPMTPLERTVQLSAAAGCAAVGVPVAIAVGGAVVAASVLAAITCPPLPGILLCVLGIVVLTPIAIKVGLFAGGILGAVGGTTLGLGGYAIYSLGKKIKG